MSKKRAYGNGIRKIKAGAPLDRCSVCGHKAEYAYIHYPADCGRTRRFTFARCTHCLQCTTAYSNRIDAFWAWVKLNPRYFNESFEE